MLPLLYHLTIFLYIKLFGGASDAEVDDLVILIFQTKHAINI